MEDREREELEALIADLADERDALLGKVRSRAHRDAAEKAFDELNVRKDATAREDLYRLAGVDEGADEPDPKAIRAKLAEALKSRKSWALDPDADGDDGAEEDPGSEDAETTEEPAPRNPGRKMSSRDLQESALAMQVPNAYRIA